MLGPLTPISCRAASSICTVEAPCHPCRKHWPALCGTWEWARSGLLVLGVSCHSCPLTPESQGPVFLCAVAHRMLFKLLSWTLCSLSNVQWGDGACAGGLEPWLMRSPATSLPLLLGYLFPFSWYLRLCQPPYPCPYPPLAVAANPCMGLGVSVGRVVPGTRSPWCLRWAAQPRQTA